MWSTICGSTLKTHFASLTIDMLSVNYAELMKQPLFQNDHYVLNSPHLQMH